MKTIVGRLVQLISFLFGLFGGFFKTIAPPEEAAASFAVGLASVVSLLLFMVLAYVCKRWQKSSRARNVLLAVAAGLAVLGTVAGFVYRSELSARTFEYPPGASRAEYIAGTELTEDASAYKAGNKSLTDSELVAKFGGIPFRDRVWPAPSRHHSATVLTGWYVAFVVSVFGAVFCLTEGLLK